MSQKNSLKVNAILNAILTLSTFVFSIITFPYASRILLPLGTGKVSFARSVCSYFLLLSQLGIPTYGIRECAKIRDDNNLFSKTVSELFVLNIFTTVFSYVAFFICLFTVERFTAERALFLVSSISIVLNCIGMNWVFQGLEKYKYITIRSLIIMVVSLIAMFIFVKNENDYIKYAAIITFSSYGANIINFFAVRKYVRFVKVKKSELKIHIKPLFVFFALVSAATIYTHLDIVMLGLMKTDTDVGYYDAAVKIKTILVSIVTSLGVVMLPRASYYYEKKQIEDFHKLLNKASEFVIVISIPMIVYFMIFAKSGISFLSGNAYGGAILPMRIIMPTILFIGLSNITGIQALVPLGKEKIVLISEVFGAIVDFIINLVLIPILSAAGAAIGTLVAEIVVWAIQAYYLKMHHIEIFGKISIPKILISSIFASLFSSILFIFDFSPFLTLVFSSIIYYSVYCCLIYLFKIPTALEVSSKIKRLILRTK